MAQIGSGGVNNAGLFIEEFSIGWLVSGVLTQAAVGKAVAWDPTPTTNTVRLAQGTIGATGALAGGVTGNPTIGTITVGANAMSGVYVARFTAATTFQLFDPNGHLIAIAPTLSTLAPTTHLGFTITAGGTAAIAGDSFNITVVQADKVIGLLSSYEDRIVEGVKVGAVAHKGVFRFPYTGSAPVVGQSVGGSAASPGSVIGVSARPGWPIVVAVNTASTTVTVAFL
jgi:hypothetical protein